MAFETGSFCPWCLNDNQDPFLVVCWQGLSIAMCVPCYAINRAASLRWKDTWTCQDCGTPSQEGLRQIHDVLRVRNGVYPIRHVCAPCRDAWWRRVQRRLMIEAWLSDARRFVVVATLSLAVWWAIRWPQSL